MYEMIWTHLHRLELHENTQKPCTNFLIQNHINDPKQGLFDFVYYFFIILLLLQ